MIGRLLLVFSTVDQGVRIGMPLKRTGNTLKFNWGIISATLKSESPFFWIQTLVFTKGGAEVEIQIDSPFQQKKSE